MTHEPITQEDLSYIRHFVEETFVAGKPVYFEDFQRIQKDVIRLIAEVERLLASESLTSEIQEKNWQEFLSLQEKLQTQALCHELQNATIKQLVGKRDAALAKIKELADKFHVCASEGTLLYYAADAYDECAEACETAYKELTDENQKAEPKACDEA